MWVSSPSITKRRKKKILVVSIAPSTRVLCFFHLFMGPKRTRTVKYRTLASIQQGQHDENVIKVATYYFLLIATRWISCSFSMQKCDGLRKKKGRRLLFRRLRQQQLLLTRRLAPGLLTWRNIDSFFASLSLLAILFPLTLFHPALSLHREGERDQYPSTI